MKNVALYCKHLDPLTDAEIVSRVKSGEASWVDKPQPEGFVLTVVACTKCMARANALEKALSEPKN